MSPTGPRASPSVPDGIAQLIRARRVGLDWSLAKLAHAAALKSPAYVFHIENGSKTPSEPVARRLAAALGLDPELLAAWARARGRADLGAVLEATETVRRWLEVADVTPGSGGVPGAGVMPSGGATPRAGVAPSAGAAPDSVEIPVLPEGADPAARPEAPRAIETLHLARALLPPLGADPTLVAYRLSAHGARRIPDSLRPGDCVVVQLGADPPGPDAPCAVRLGGRVEIARVRVRDGAVHLPPPAGANDSERSDVRIGRSDGDTIVGRVVLTFRRWL